MVRCFNLAYETGYAYYDRGKARIEMTPLGINHAEDTSIIDTLVSIFCTRKGIPLRGLNRCSFRKTNLEDCQPDLAFYLDSLENSPPRSNSPVNLDKYTPPALVVELTSAIPSNELGEKQLLYERMGMQEYWVIDVTNVTPIAFALAEGSSRPIQVSQVLPSLAIEFVQITLERSRLEEKSSTTRWLWSEFG
jgi:Uma2 family endonuclease